MPKNAKTVTLEVTPEQLAAFEKVLALLPIADEAAVEVTTEDDGPCGAETKAGGACKLKASACRHHGGEVAEVTEAEEAEVEDAPEVTILRKATRKDFIKAAAEQHGVDLTGWSVRDIAASVIAEEVELPEGFDIGEGYRKLIADSYEL